MQFSCRYIPYQAQPSLGNCKTHARSCADTEYHTQLYAKQDKKIEVKIPGESSNLPGESLDRIKFENTNDKLTSPGKYKAVGDRG
ncbi:MAG: hypothetical protein VW931_08110, partial [Alphaproteobacteria bacterium]